ncbi:MAG: iron-sulfur cluster repair di-iron protein [Mycobacterium leprae]
MSGIDTHMTIAEIVVNRPDLMRVLEKIGIDYCCGGKKTLEKACLEKGLDATSIVLTLEALGSAAPASADQTDWAKASLTDLANHIENTHHKFCKEELPRLSRLVAKVAQVHGPHNPKLADIQRAYEGVKDELLQHLPKEEEILFPAIRNLEANPAQKPPFGSVAFPIQQMELEHDSAGRLLEQIRELTEDFAVPDYACNSYKAMLQGLEDVERDTHQHIHKENNILFPRAIALEKQLG